MIILDIDLDFFLDRRARMRPTHKRLPSGEYMPWSATRVRDYLASHCRLENNRKTRGCFVTDHHELFDIWKGLIEARQLTIPFKLAHIDAHADMGMGDISCGYIMGELLHHEIAARALPKRGSPDGLLPGNFVLFAIACRWISSITYVHHPYVPRENEGIHDIPNCLFRNNDPHSGVIQLKKLPPDCRSGSGRLTEYEPLELEPEVPLELVDGNCFHASDPFSYVFVAQSPGYTPSTSDALLDVMREFIQDTPCSSG